MSTCEQEIYEFKQLALNHPLYDFQFKIPFHLHSSHKRNTPKNGGGYYVRELILSLLDINHECSNKSG